MSQNASAPFWVRALIIVVLLILAVPAWLFLAGHGFALVAFRGHMDSVHANLWTWPYYWQHYSAYDDTRRFLVLSGTISGAICLAPFALILMRPGISQHGDAKWASKGDIRRAGLLDDTDNAIIVGKLPGGEYLRAGLAKYPHVMLAAPTGGGKGVGTVLPNLFNWNGSAIILDIKLENWKLTAGWRAKHGHKVYLFSPLDPERRTHRWNPFAYVSANPHLRVDDVQSIAQILFPDVDGADPIWTGSCRSLFTGVVLYLFETESKPVTLGQLARETYAGDDKRWEKIINARKAEGNPLSPACVSNLLDYVKTSDNTRSSIRKTFTSRFELFTNPLVDAATSGNDFNIDRVRNERISIYLGITPKQLPRLAPLLNLFFQQVIDIGTSELPENNPALKYECLLLMDEFKSLGKLKNLVEAIAFLRGYGFRLLPIFQAPSQVRDAYGVETANTFFKNHAIRIAYTPADMDDATEISKELGNFTYKSTSKSTPLGIGKGNSSKSESDHARNLLLPQEVRDLGDDEVIIFAKGCKPIRAKKIKWYEDKDFKNNVVPPPDVPPVDLPAGADIEAFEDAAAEEEQTRPVEATDMETIYDRPTSDFSVNFSNVQIPTGDLSDEQAEALADQLYADMSR